MKLYTLILKSCLIALSISSLASADIYKCKTIDNKTIFQDKPCDADMDAEDLSNNQLSVSKNCYQLTLQDEKVFEIKEFWTIKQAENKLFSTKINRKEKTFFLDEIEDVKVNEIKNKCALTTIENKYDESFDVSICEEIHYTNNLGEAKITPSELKSIKPCLAKHPKMAAEGFWEYEDKKYTIHAAYARYIKDKNQLEVLLFPFELTREEIKNLDGATALERFLTKTKQKQGDNYRVFGILLEFQSDKNPPKGADIKEFKSLLFNNENKMARNYDKWRWAFSTKKLEINTLEKGGELDMVWSLKDINQKAEVSISAIIIE